MQRNLGRMAWTAALAAAMGGSTCALLAADAAPGRPARASGPRVDYNRDVRPILAEHCFNCHGFDEKKRQAGLRLDERAGALRAALSGKPAVVPGRPRESELLRRVAARDGLRMPPAGADKALSPEQVAVLRRWIAQGAEYAPHWAYVPPRLPPLPTVKDRAWVRNPVDAFVLARLEQAGLRPSPEADPYTLIRRVTLDLTGLPPTPAEVDAFVRECGAEQALGVEPWALGTPPGEGPRRAASGNSDTRAAWMPRREPSPGAAQAPPQGKAQPARAPAGRRRPSSDAGLRQTTNPENTPTYPHPHTSTRPRQNANSSTAYERLVDRLLNDPAFGERWARPWLDLARYADSHGFQRDDLRDLWPYRDWVIRALNADMPYDQFTIEQLAGDLLPNATPEQKIATGFHRCTTTNVEAGSEPEETRVNQVIDRVNTTAAVWLGTTLECAQCHDHKYDPFTQRDYYRLLAFFNNTAMEADRSDPKVPGSIRFLGPLLVLPDPARDAVRARVTAEARRLDQELERLRRELDPTLARWSVERAVAAGVPEEIAALLKVPPEKWTRAQTAQLLDYRLEADPEGARLKAERARAERELQELRPAAPLVMQELPQPRKTAIFTRGDYRQPGEVVSPGTPTALPAPPEPAADRLALARWMVSPRNPLAARAAVNRWWAELFGRGLVLTAEDFGAKGEPPSHPELLDWLAATFSAEAITGEGGVGSGFGVQGSEEASRQLVAGGRQPAAPQSAIGEPQSAIKTPAHPHTHAPEQGLAWSLKRLLRLLVTSSTYRQASGLPNLRKSAKFVDNPGPPPARNPQSADPENRLLWRGPRFRMDAERIRDNALAAAGLLSLKQFGPPVRPYQPEGLWTKIGGERVDYVVSPGEDRYRRGIYVVWKRASPYPSFVSFDASARLACTVRRSRSNTPLQALALLNDPVYVEAAMALAKRALVERPDGDVEDRIGHAFRLCLVRPPKPSELRTLRRLYEGQLAAYREDGAPARELVAGYAQPPGVGVEEYAAWYTVASALLNLDEMITRG